MTSLETVSLPHRRRISSVTSTDSHTSRSVSLPSIETQLQNSQELYSLLRELAEQDGGVERVAEIQAEVKKNRNIMDESRRGRAAVIGEGVWHNAINAFSADVIYNWDEEFEDYRMLASLPFDSKCQLTYSVESNEIHMPDIPLVPSDNSSAAPRKLSNDASSVGILSSTSSVVLTQQVSNNVLLNSPTNVPANATSKILSRAGSNVPSNTSNTPSTTSTIPSNATSNTPSTIPSTTSNAPSNTTSKTLQSTLSSTPSSEINNVNATPATRTTTNGAQTSSTQVNMASEVVNASSNSAPLSAPHPTISLSNLPSSPLVSAASCHSRSSSVASAMSPPIHPVLTSPRLNIPGSPLISTPRLRSHPSSISVSSGVNSNTLNEIMASPRLFPVSASLSFNATGSPPSLRLSSLNASRQDAELFISGRRHIPIMHNDSLPQVSQPDSRSVSTEKCTTFFNQDTASISSEHTSFFSNNSNSPRETPVSTFIAVDEDMKPLLETSTSQGTQVSHPTSSLTLPANSALSRSKRALLRAVEPTDETSEVVSGVPKDSRSDVSRVSFFVSDLDKDTSQAPNSSEPDDFMQEMDRALPADFQQEFLSEIESMSGAQ